MLLEKKKAVLLLSGGLDSATVLAIAQSKGYAVYALSFHYGQRHSFELQCVEKLALKYALADHKVIAIDLRAFGGSALTAEIDVPKNHYDAQSTVIPVTYVPARNTIFLSFALAYAETVGATDIFIGAHAVDYSHYPDCRPEYLACFEALANLATAAGVKGSQFKIHAPLLQMGKAEIIQTGIGLGVDYSITMSCYDPSVEGFSCGQCDACSIRLKGFAENHLKDPVPYVKP